MRESDVILFMVDGQQGRTPVDEDLARMFRRSHKPLILVVNKIDHPKHRRTAISILRSSVFRCSFHQCPRSGRGLLICSKRIDRLLPSNRSTPQRLRLIPAIRSALAIVGKPNAGKSSLINSIVRDERAIVSELPGTTRDAFDIRCERGGKEFLLIDTAGIRARSKHSSSVEVFSVMRERNAQVPRGFVRARDRDLTSELTPHRIKKSQASFKKMRANRASSSE